MCENDLMYLYGKLAHSTISKWNTFKIRHICEILLRILIHDIRYLENTLLQECRELGIIDNSLGNSKVDLKPSLHDHQVKYSVKYSVIFYCH